MCVYLSQIKKHISPLLFLLTEAYPEEFCFNWRENEEQLGAFWFCSPSLPFNSYSRYRACPQCTQVPCPDFRLQELMMAFMLAKSEFYTAPFPAYSTISFAHKYLIFSCKSWRYLKCSISRMQFSRLQFLGMFSDVLLHPPPPKKKWGEKFFLAIESLCAWARRL